MIASGGKSKGWKVGVNQKSFLNLGRILLCHVWYSKSLCVEDLDATPGQCHQTSTGKGSQIPGDYFPRGSKISGDRFVGYFYFVFPIGGPK